jgi:hypothetical protein
MHTIPTALRWYSIFHLIGAASMAYLPNKRIYTSNIIIGAAIALFIYFLKQSFLLEHILAYIITFLLKIHFTLIRNRFYYAPSTINLISDFITIAIAAYLWTCFKTAKYRLLSNILLAILLIPVSLLIYDRYGVILTAFLIVCGIIICITIEAVVDHMSRLFHLKILEEKQEAEFSILRHLNHNVKPNIQILKSPLNAVFDFLDDNKLLGKVLAKRLDGSEETVGEALQKAVTGLNQINDILDNTRKLVTQQIAKEDYREYRIIGIFEEEVIPLHSGKIRINVSGDDQLTVNLH